MPGDQNEKYQGEVDSNFFCDLCWMFADCDDKYKPYYQGQSDRIQ